MSTEDPRETAAECFRQGFEAQSRGDYEKALDYYSRSIVAFPTPEAYTFRGWTYSFLGDYDRAMSECFEAIKLDPDFGNPYNDIGAYLIEQGKWDEAIPWFEKAIEAKRYDARVYPHFNLGRVYEHKNDFERAKTFYSQAYGIDERYTAALAGIKRMWALFN